MTTTKIEAIAERSAESLKGLFLDMAEDIEAAIHAATTQAEEDEKDSIKLTLSHSIVLDLGKNIQEDKLSVSVKHSKSAAGFIPDPQQPELDLED